jgi:hypothetical protein
MKQNKRTMHKRRSSSLAIAALVIGQLATMHGFGQHLEIEPFQIPSYPDGSVTTIRPITDDGDDLSLLSPAGQLIISFKATSGDSYGLEVFDEKGRCVMQRHGTSREGRNLMPLTVTPLEQGRYVVRVQQGGAVRHSRFMRP